jgi:hypothetical protein
MQGDICMMMHKNKRTNESKRGIFFRAVTMRIKDVNPNAVRLRQYPFSLRGKAKD